MLLITSILIRYYSLHHTQFRTNHCLFMPFYDYIYNTMDKSSHCLYEISLKGKEEQCDGVRLTHPTSLQFVYHLGLGFAILASKSYNSKWYMLLVWPLSLPMSVWGLIKDVSAGMRVHRR